MVNIPLLFLVNLPDSVVQVWTSGLIPRPMARPIHPKAPRVILLPVLNYACSPFAIAELSSEDDDGLLFGGI
jgi:hypothetical protein